jgi:nucleoporin NUP42
MQTALNDVDGAINYIIRAENDHPNRIDICRESQATSAGSQRGVFQRNQEYPIDTRSQKPAAAPPFGAPAQPGAFGQPASGAFGQASALGQKPNPFGAPSGAFGQSSGGTFGQPSALGQKQNPFGASTPAFGAPTQPGGVGAFGQPSAIGQKPNPFGAPSGVFGQPSGGAFGQPSAPEQQPNPFGTQPAALASFGTPSQPQPNPFGAPTVQNPSPFGAPTPTSQPNPFGTTPAPFGAPSQAPKNPFGTPSQPASSSFGVTPVQQTNPFGAPAAGSPFGTPQPPSQPAANPFGNPQSTPGPAISPFGNPPSAQPQAQPHVNGSTFHTGHPPLSQYSTRDGNGRLVTWKNKRVVYKEDIPGTQNFDGTWAKIWFPDGPPVPDKLAEAAPELYTDDVKKAYENARINGVFDGGVLPLVPPKQEWCQWDF